MRNIKWLVAATFAVSMTGCVEMDGYPTTSYGGYPGGYGYSNGYYAQPTYYQQPVVTQTRYVPVPVAQPAPRPYYHRDRDGDGDHHNWDKNGDGIPDRLQHN
jgi:hypothetical protein